VIPSFMDIYLARQRFQRRNYRFLLRMNLTPLQALHDVADGLRQSLRGAGLRKESLLHRRSTAASRRLLAEVRRAGRELAQKGRGFVEDED